MTETTGTSGHEPEAAGDETGAAGGSEVRRAPRWRRILVSVLVVLGCVLAPLSVLGVWVHNTILDTDQFVATVGPLADHPDVQEAAANRVATAIIERSDIEAKIADALPTQAAFLAPSIAKGLDQFVEDAALKFTQSPEFSKLWKEVNRRAHTRVVAVLEGKGTETIQTKNGQVTIDLAPIVTKVQDRLSARGIDVLADVTADARDRRIVLFESKSLNTAQQFTKLLNALAWVLPVLTLLFFVAAIWLSANRRRTILRGALGVALGMGLLLVLFNAGRHLYLSSLPSSVNQSAAAAIYDQLLSFLRLSLRTAFVLAVVIALAAWLLGPTRAATRIRARVLALVRGGEKTEPLTPLAAFTARNRTALRIVVIVIGLAVIAALSAPTPLQVIVVAVLVLVGILLIEFIGRSAISARSEANDWSGS